MRNSFQNLALLALLLVQPSFLRSLPDSLHRRAIPPTRFKVGITFRSFTPEGAYNWRGAKTRALVTTVLYPAATSVIEHPIEISGLSSIFVLGSAATDADIASSPSKLPLVVAARPTSSDFKTAQWDEVLDGIVIFREERPPEFFEALTRLRTAEWILPRARPEWL